MSKVNPIPDGFASVSVALVVPDVGQSIAFYKEALGAREGDCMWAPDGKSILHGEIHLGDSTVMLSPENESWGNKSPATLGGSPVSMFLYVSDSDAAFKRAVNAGCEVVYPMEDTFWGDRFGKVKDPFGHTWGLSTRREALTPEEVEKRGHEWLSRMAAAS
jgi:PhnB protein